MPTKKKLRYDGIRTIFREYDTDCDGHLDRIELERLLQAIPERGGVVFASDFSKEDVGRVLEAFDEDGNGLVEEEEFVHWVSKGLSQTKQTRQMFAQRTPLAAKLNRFLTAIERVIGKWKRLQNLRLRKVRRNDVDSNNKIRRVKSSGKVAKKNKTRNNMRKVKSFHQPIFSPHNTDASSAANLSSSIKFSFRNVNFGRTVLRTAKHKKIFLVNDTDYEISVLLSLRSGRGFSVVKPGNNLAAFQRYLVAARQQLVVPLRYRPMLLGNSNVSIIAKCTTINHGRAVFRVVSNLSGIGV